MKMNYVEHNLSELNGINEQIDQQVRYAQQVGENKVYLAVNLDVDGDASHQITMQEPLSFLKRKNYLMGLATFGYKCGTGLDKASGCMPTMLVLVHTPA